MRETVKRHAAARGAGDTVPAGDPSPTLDAMQTETSIDPAARATA
jgi:hypothetical protein